MLLGAIVMGSVVIFSPLFIPTLLVLLTIRMVNFKDPAVIASDIGAWALNIFLLMRSSPAHWHLSGTQEVPVFGGWFLHVGQPPVTIHYLTQLLTPSWEFMTTLGYEWNVIQERLRYRWTIWVRSRSPFPPLFCDIPVRKKV